jgi:hypothetical protein
MKHTKANSPIIRRTAMANSLGVTGQHTRDLIRMIMPMEMEFSCKMEPFTEDISKMMSSSEEYIHPLTATKLIRENLKIKNTKGMEDL